MVRTTKEKTIIVMNPNELVHFTHGILRTVVYPSMESGIPAPNEKTRRVIPDLSAGQGWFQRDPKQKCDGHHGRGNNNEPVSGPCASDQADMPVDWMYRPRTVTDIDKGEVRSRI